jgi:hypothetical protein
MGTRNTTLVQSGGEYKIAQYCQWDGYPSGQGMVALETLRTLDLADFKTKVDGLTVLSDKQVEAMWKKAGAKNGMATLAVSEKFEKAHPHLHRNCGAKIIEMVASGQVTSVQLETKFPADSLFCEWAYVVDLDKGVFEVYEGFNQKVLLPDERFYPLQMTEESQEAQLEAAKKGDDFYYPVKLKCSWPLSALPTNEEFIAKADAEEEEVETEPSAPAIDPAFAD